MGRENTIVFGSQRGGTSTSAHRPSPRTGTLVQQRSVTERSRAIEPASPSVPRAASPDGARQRYASDAGAVSPAPVSNRLESQWFAPTNPGLTPIGHEIFEERRGWQPPPPSRGIAFTAVSVLLVAVAGAGTLFLVGPDANRSSSTTAVSTTTITNAEVPATPQAAEPATTAQDTATAPRMGTMTPHDLPSAPPMVDAVKEPGPPGWHPEKAAAARKADHTTGAPAARNQKAVAPPAKRATTPSATKRSEGSLPDLDRAASAAGMTTQQDDPFATPGTETPPAPAATAPAATAGSGASAVSPGSPASTEPSAPATATPAPSEVMPDLEIKR